MSERSELKENVLASNVEVALNWAINNKTPVLTGLGVLISGILIASVFVLREQEKRSLNWTRLAQAQSLINEKRYDAADQVLKDVIDLGTGSTAALYAQYNQGLVALDQKKFDEAIRLFSDLIARTSKEPIRPLALSNLGFSYEQKGDFSKAAKTYQQFMDQYAEHFLAARVQLRMGQALFHSGDMNAAKKALGQLVDLYPTSPWAKRAREIMDKIQSR